MTETDLLTLFEAEWGRLEEAGADLPTNHYDRIATWARAEIDPAIIRSAIGSTMRSRAVFRTANDKFNYCAATVRNKLQDVAAEAITPGQAYMLGVQEGRTDLYEAVQDLLGAVQDLLFPEPEQ